MADEESEVSNIVEDKNISLQSPNQSSTSSNVIIGDYRFLWVWDKVMKFFLLDSNHRHLFENLLNENDGYFNDKFTEFFNSELYGEMDLEKKVIYFYKTYRKEIVQEEILVWEECIDHDDKAPATSFSGKGRSQRLTKSAPGKVEKVEEEKSKTKGKKKKGKKEAKSDDNSISSSNLFTGVSATNVHIDIDNEDEEEMSLYEDDEIIDNQYNLQKTKLQSKSSSFVPPPGEENKYVLTKKIIDKEMELPVLHLFFGKIPVNENKNLENNNFMYFSRTSEEEIPQFESQQECSNRITNYLIIGSINGPFLETLNNMLLYVFKPMLEKQYRGVSAALKQIKKHGEESLTEQINTIESQAPEFTKASNYYNLSIAVENLDANLQNQPSLTTNKTETPTTTDKTDDASQVPTESSKLKLLEYLDKLTTSVEWTLKHLEGDVLLQLPRISEIIDMDLINVDLSKLEENKMKKLEEILMDWGKHIEKVLHTFVNETPQGKGPLSEYNYWHHRETGLSMVVEQLNLPVIKKILSSNEIDSSITSTCHWFEIELWKLYTEARNNNKFLITVLRYFEMMSKSHSFEAISAIIPSLMENMRMIWILSNYYNSEEKMTALLERISWQLCENVQKNLSIKELFSKPLKDILTETKNAHAMMHNWKASYLKTRATIELTGKGVRWEFNQLQLFKKTDYIAKVCNDLNNIASVLEDFYNIFGLELKSIVTDPIQIDLIVEKVDEIIIPIQNSDFNIFSEFNKENWDATMVWFYLEVESLENEAKYLIDDCFAGLINAEQALELLMKFKNIKTRQTIHDCLLMKFDIIMQQFIKEFNEIENIFHLEKKDPPVVKYHTPTVGAIHWVRQLYNKLTRSVIAFKDVLELKDSYMKSLAFDQYSKIIKEIKEYEVSKYTSWIERVKSLTKNVMKKKILKTTVNENFKLAEERRMMTKVVDSFTKKPKADDSQLTFSLKNSVGKKSICLNSLKLNSRHTTKVSLCNDDKMIKSSVNSSRLDESSHLPKITCIGPDDKIMIQKQLSFQVNFDRQIFELIDEAGALELLDFDIPLQFRDICLQKKRLMTDTHAVQSVINDYNEIMNKLDFADINLLMNEIKSIERYIESGVQRLTWSSLEILDYCTHSTKLLKNLSSTVSQLKQLKDKLDNLIEDEISLYNLCSTTSDPNDPEYKLSLCKAYFIDVESQRLQLVNKMLIAYRSVSPLLKKIENLVESASTGTSAAMQYFYISYEKKIFTALITCFIRNLEYFNKRLNENKALFLVDAVLLSTEVILRPSPSEINVLILNDIKILLEKLKMFPRWTDKSCLECEPIESTHDDDTFLYTFFDDVVRIQAINDQVKDIYETTQKLTSEIWKYMYRWKRYSDLWRLDKAQICEKFATQNPTLSQYDERFTFYDLIIEEVDAIDPHYDIISIRINLNPLIKSIKYHAQEWKQILGNFLSSHVQYLMKNLQSKIDKFRSEIELVITGLNRFKTVMQSITNIKNMAIQAELEYLEYQETFRTLKSHGISYPEENEVQAHKLEREWQSVYFGALFRSTTLNTTKDCFREMSKEQILTFLKECADFMDYFKKDGPGSVGDNFEAGFKKIEECAQLIANMEERKDDLIKAERMFDLSPTDYSIFTEIKAEFEATKLIYALYRKQQDARDAWAKTLWTDLNPQQLIDGMEQFINEFQSLPEKARQLTIGKTLESTMENFKNSVPLFIELKNEAMRERHWKELMNKTNQHADVSSHKSDDI